jgi:hypothetical protein
MAKINLDIGHALSREDQHKIDATLVLSRSLLPLILLRKSRGEVLKKIEQLLSLKF